ncbi:MAG: hypothetical protein IJR79_03540 [Clostridia bacterium]|nr:hypothetical protein [Clostridia bacterium]
MFDINDLMTPKVRARFDKLTQIRSQAVFLLQLLDYTLYFPDEADEITRYCKDCCNEIYDTGKFLKLKSYSEFIKNYASRVHDIDEVKKLINELCSGILDEMDNLDEIIDKAQSVFEPVQSIDDYEFSVPMPESKVSDKKKKTLTDIMKYKELVTPQRFKKEKKKE